MAIPFEQGHFRMGMDPDSTFTPNGNCTIDVSDVRTVKVGNISLSVSERDIREFFSFSGTIEFVEMRSESERTQVAYVSFADSQGADTAVLLTGATIGDLSVTITPVENYEPPPAYRQIIMSQQQQDALRAEPSSAVQKAEDVVSSMLAKGFVLSKDALNLAKSFDEKHQLLSNVANLDRQIGLSDKIYAGTALVSYKMKEVDNRFQVTELTKSALAAAEQKATELLSNKYLSSSTSWLSTAFGTVLRAAGEVTSKTMEKVERAEEQRKDSVWRERNGLVSDYARLNFEDLPTSWEPATVPVQTDEQSVRIF